MHKRHIPLKYRTSFNYIKNVVSFSEFVREISLYSNKTQNILASKKFYFASKLFTLICVKLNSIVTLLPYRTDTTNWDSSTLQSLTRIAIENLLIFLYFSEKASKELLNFKILIFHLNDCTNRINIFRLLKEEQTVQGFEKQKKLLLKKIHKNTYFKTKISHVNGNFYSKEELLKGKYATIEKLPSIAVRYGYTTEEDFNFRYKYRSQFIHSLPIAFERMKQDQRGCGVYSDFEEDVINDCVQELIPLIKQCFQAYQRLKEENDKLNKRKIKI